MKKALYSIIGLLLLTCIYLTTQAFNSTIDTDPYASDTPYNEDVDGTVTFGDFTTFEYTYTDWSTCSPSCGNNRTQARSVNGCLGNDGVLYNANNYEACGGYQAPESRSCPSTTCYTGTWRSRSAPACNTSCGISAYTATATGHYCDGPTDTCDPNATKPTLNTRSCPATAACRANCTTEDGVTVNDGSTQALYHGTACNSPRHTHTCTNGSFNTIAGRNNGRVNCTAPVTCTFLRPYGWNVGGQGCIEGGFTRQTILNNGQSMTVHGTTCNDGLSCTGEATVRCVNGNIQPQGGATCRRGQVQ